MSTYAVVWLLFTLNTAPTPANVRTSVERAAALAQGRRGAHRQADLLRLPQPGAAAAGVRRRPRTRLRRAGRGPEGPDRLRRRASSGATRSGSGRAKGPAGRSTPPGTPCSTLELGGHKPDETTAAVVEYLLKSRADRDHWRTSSRTARRRRRATSRRRTWPCAACGSGATDDQKEAIAKRVEAARGWL